MFPIPLIHPTEGYGQLSITGTPLAVLGHRTSAGVWGLIGPAADVDPLKAQGPSATAAVVAFSTGATVDAVYAESMLHAAVTAVGHTDNVPAIQATHDGTTGGATAIQGTSTSGRGLAGFSSTWQGVYGHSKSQAGVVGESDQFDGVFGISHNPSAAGVSGHNPGGLAGFFDGNLTVTGDILLPGGDCAEQFETTDAADPGSVMIFDDSERLSACTEPYDRRVAGVVSGANRYRPGIILNGQEPAANRRPIALIGRVYCKVDASFGRLEVGDLLTTSPNPGHAMKVLEPSKAVGAILGKALRSLSEGQELIPILVALQ